MSEKDENPKPEGFEALVGRLVVILLNRWVLTPLLILAVGGGGWAVADVGGAKAVSADTARHIADSTTKAQLQPLQTKVESLEKKTDDLAREVQESREIQAQVFGAMMDADPKLQKAVQARAQQNQAAANKKEETAKLLKNLTGGPPQ